MAAAAGIWMSFLGEPAMAAKSTAKTSVAAADRPMVLSKYKKKRAHVARKSQTSQARHARKSASKASLKTKVLAQKSTDKPPGIENKAVADTGKNQLPPAVANARAQALADDQARNIAALDSTDVVDGMQTAAAEPANSGESTPANNTIVAQDTTAAPTAVAPPPEPTPSGKIIRPVPSGDRPVYKTADDSDPWSKTSLIGKIFIAFGSLLTLASAARLLIA
ncbi:hypothetical protein BH10PSE11_BH10PSE11_09870 [soil metagenome]